MYGKSTDEVTTGDDRPLPPELRGRIDRWRKKHAAAQLLQRSAALNTFNAFIRERIQSGEI